RSSTCSTRRSRTSCSRSGGPTAGSTCSSARSAGSGSTAGSIRPRRAGERWGGPATALSYASAEMEELVTQIEQALADVERELSDPAVASDQHRQGARGRRHKEPGGEG